MELKVEKLSKTFGSQIALSDISLDLSSGYVAVLGPNGSGKTTLLRCLATLMQPDCGHLWFDGCSYHRYVQLIRSRIGYLPQELHLPDHMSGRRLLNYLAALKVSDTSEQVEDLIGSLGLEKIADKPFISLSHGEMRLFGLAQACLGRPRLLLLDEPTRGLDVKERARVFSLLRHYPASHLIIYTTHNMEDITTMADRIIVLYEGKVAFDGAVKDLHFVALNCKDVHNRIDGMFHFLNTVAS